MERASSVRPAPMSPAKPTISPRRATKLSSSQTSLPGTVGCSTVQPFTSMTSSPPVFGSWSGYRLSSERPTIARMIRSSST